jgi:hypothetical protein
MTDQEVAKLLTAIAAVDDRIDPDSARLSAWAFILDKDMTYSFALEQVRKHYAGVTKTMMPADLNLPWRNFRAKEISMREIEYAREQKRELQPKTRELIEQLKSRWAIDNPEKSTEKDIDAQEQ